MRIFSAVQSDITDRAARDVGAVRSREERRVLDGFGFAVAVTAGAGAAGDEVNVGLRLQAAGTSKIVVTRAYVSVSVSVLTFAYMNTGILAAPGVTALGAGSNRLASSTQDTQAEAITQVGVGITPAGSAVWNSTGLTALTPTRIEGPWIVDVALDALTFNFVDLGAGTARVAFHWYEE